MNPAGTLLGLECRDSDRRFEEERIGRREDTVAVDLRNVDEGRRSGLCVRGDNRRGARSQGRQE